MAADGSVVLNFDANVSEAEKELERLRKDIIKLQTDITTKTSQKGILAAQLEAAKKEYIELQHSLRNFSATEIDTDPEAGKVVARMQELDKYITKTESDVEKITLEVDRANTKLEATKETYGEIAQGAERLSKSQDASGTSGVLDRANEKLTNILDKMMKHHAVTIEINKALGDVVDTQTKLVGLSEEFTESLKIGAVGAVKTIIESLMGIRDKLTDAVTGIKDKLVNAIKAVPGKAFEVLKSGFSKALKSAAAATLSAFKTAGKAIVSATKKAFSFMQNMNILSKMSDAFGKKLKRLGQMIRRVFVFSVITAGLRTVRTQMSAYLTMNNDFSAALSRIKGVLLTAFQPIYDAVVPAFTTLLNVLSRVIAVISQFTATLFGTTAKQAQDNAKALYDQAKATEAAGSAADDAGKSFANFDEINQLQDKSTSSGSGGSGSTSEIAPAFDYDYDGTMFDSWGEAFSAFLDNVLSGISRLKDAFSGFSVWMNELSGKLLEMFAFPGVRDKVAEVGTDLALAFNGLFDGIDWATLGAALGAGLDLALLGLTSFLYTFDWAALGGDLAGLINGLVQMVDWENLGRLVFAGFKIALEFLAGLLLGLDMPELAKAASKTVMGFFDSMRETIAGIEWEQIGIQIATLLNELDWVGILKGIARSIATGINAAIDLLSGLVTTLEWDKVGTAVGESINTAFEEVEWDKAGKTVSDALYGAIDFAINAIEVTDWKAIGQDIVTFLENIEWMDLLENLGVLIGDAIVAALDLFFSDPIGLIRIGGQIIAGLLLGIFRALEKIALWILHNVVDPIIQAVKDFFGIHSPSTVFADIGGFLMQGLIDGVLGMVERVKAVFSGLWEDIQGVFAHVSDWFKEKFSAAWQAVKDVFSKGGEVFTGIKDGILDGLKTVINTLIGGINKVIAVPFNGINAALKKIREIEILGLSPFSRLGTISVPQIPKLAQGAVIPPNREFMAILGDQKSGQNIEAPEDLIRKIVREESGGNGQTVALLQAILSAVKAGQVMEVDRRQFGQVVRQAYNEESRRVGVNFAGGSI